MKNPVVAISPIPRIAAAMSQKSQDSIFWSGL
jgi:hypothetical protein